jgi:regulator of RNase E activity RraA
MSQQIFDQNRPRSTMAQRLDEAFAGCDVWTVAPPTQRRSTLDLSPRASSSSRILGSAATVRTQESRAL